MKPVLYDPKAKDFDSDGGLATLSDCRSLIVTEEANGAYLAEATFPITTKFSEYLEDVNYQIKCKTNDIDPYHIFYIYDHYKDMATGLLYVNAKSRTAKLGNRTIQKVDIVKKTGIEAMALLHDSMDLESDIKLFSDITDTGSTSFSAINLLECIKGVEGSLNQIYGGEIKHDPNRLSLLKRRGKDDVTTIRYGKNLEGLKLEFNWDNLITRVFPYADIQNKEGETERIFGEKVDSEFINNYDGEVYSRHIQFTEDQGVTDLKSLNEVAKKYFKSMNKGIDKPKVSAEVELKKLDDNNRFKDFRKLGLFDTFTVFHERYRINLTLTVNKITYDALNEQIEKIEAGDPKFTFFEQQQSDFSEVMKQVPTKSYSSVFIDYVTQIISGNDGGNVIWWPKNRPSDLFFVDGESLEDSKKVLRINKSGIGFSKNGWKGPFETAWTLNGVFIADFIQAGTLRAIDIEGVKITGSKFITSLIDGDFMGITADGINFWDGDPEGGASSFGWLKQLGVDDDRSIQLTMRIKEGNTISPTGIAFYNKELTIDHPKRINLNAPEVLVNGVSINTGSGGSGNGNGSWDGTYPSNVTSDRDKRYWQIWALAVLNGMTKAAAAALCGNAQGESDANPKADEANGEKGFGYGIWQWTDSNGQLSGRDYMISLMNKAGITEDPDTTEAQFKLMMWHAENGQWIATNDYPYSFGQFKQLNNVATATTAFERNFERPATTHPERVDYANDWYNKFQGLEVTTSGAWVNPLHNVSYTVTQEWDQIGYGTDRIHGGIDLAPNGGATPPIYAARTGTVQQVVYNDETGGNYIIVKHSDSYWTYYGHLASVNVKQGDNVSTSNVLGICGATGLATGVHLHFEVWKGGEWQRINPRDVIKF